MKSDKSCGVRVPQVKEVPRWCRRCREVVPHVCYENISRRSVVLLSAATLGAAYPFLNRYYRKSQNRCLYCSAENNGRYFNRQRQRQRKRTSGAATSLRV
ncbi:hypothetical protein CA51_45940 [Rosistilla oblonga]|uniref:Uncharacterized protein n=1 Tax=Rosistilla oblonga TaxID=2527990 RepID=A0A518IVQ7_9BACT|nr:hypothetical protein [Rosistilla oblonga]QDV14684.1 hypothetical protein CA51_45940 [Rosistilla oblonga]QDV57165.1 hypothetical protein Mal33_31660 [Rosistilla oblonga]